MNTPIEYTGTQIIISIPNWFLYVAAIVGCLYVYDTLIKAIAQAIKAFKK
jgi:hypothetical protein